MFKQVVAAWPFLNQGPKWSVPTFLSHVVELALPGVELLDVEHWPLLKKHGLICAATKSHSFVRGMNNLNHQPECLATLGQAIEDSAEAGFPNVMTFTGLLDTRDQPKGSLVDSAEALKNCIEGYKKIVGKAEKAGVTLILEPLNSKVDVPMKGHPGYSGDHVSECIEIIEGVGSPALKLLFDVYHIQIMDGNLVQHLRDHRELIGHVQTAGVPGRGFLSSDQEINYAAIANALNEIGYNQFVGHEWLPGSNPIAELKESINALAI